MSGERSIVPTLIHLLEVLDSVKREVSGCEATISRYVEQARLLEPRSLKAKELGDEIENKKVQIKNMSEEYDNIRLLVARLKEDIGVVGRRG